MGSTGESGKKCPGRLSRASMDEHYVFHKGVPALSPLPLLHLPFFPLAQPSLSPDSSVESGALCARTKTTRSAGLCSG